MKLFVHLTIGLFASICFSVVAQQPQRGPDGRTTVRVSGVEVLAIPGKPFSARDNIDWTRTLEDGSTVTLHLDAALARDSRGRIYRERHGFIPAGSNKPSPLYDIHLYDPESRSQLLCNGIRRSCVLSDWKPETAFSMRPEGPFDHGTRTLARESLGSQVIGGIYANGTRETITILPGTAGNNHAIVTTREYWYSDELQTNLAVTRINPAEGKQAIWLSNISRDEPDPNLWKVPSGFTVHDVRSRSVAAN
jgi:hypothetical protein